MNGSSDRSCTSSHESSLTVHGGQGQRKEPRRLCLSSTTLSTIAGARLINSIRSSGREVGRQEVRSRKIAHPISRQRVSQVMSMENVEIKIASETPWTMWRSRGLGVDGARVKIIRVSRLCQLWFTIILALHTKQKKKLDTAHHVRRY